jgi:hypothetical protein
MLRPDPLLPFGVAVRSRLGILGSAYPIPSWKHEVIQTVEAIGLSFTCWQKTGGVIWSHWN